MILSNIHVTRVMSMAMTRTFIPLFILLLDSFEEIPDMNMKPPAKI